LNKKPGNLTPNEEHALCHAVNFFGIGFTALFLLFALGEAARVEVISREYLTPLMCFIVAGFFWFGFIQLRAYKTQLETDPMQESD